jgi:putative transposase
MDIQEALVLERRMRLVLLITAGTASFSACCREVGLSRKAGRKWWTRFEQEGPAGLHDRSRAPAHQALALSPDVIALIVQLRLRYGWGADKLQAKLRSDFGLVVATSTIGRHLREAGLTASPRGKPAGWAGRSGRTVAVHPNEVWTLDAKGWFLTGRGQRCEPLTVLDDATRFALDCTALSQLTFAHAYACLKACFQHYGLPQVIRTDNGSPFASRAWTRLSRLQVWWLKLGITSEQIPPGRPTANGRHERFHRTLKAACCTPPAPTLRRQQGVFDHFLLEYNSVRPHAALDQTPPAHHYTPSPRPYPEQLPELIYPEGCVFRRVRTDGTFSWRGDLVFLTEVLVGERIGLLPRDERWWTVYIGPRALCQWDALRCLLRPLGPPGGADPAPTSPEL